MAKTKPAAKKQKGFEFSFVVYSDGTYDEHIDLQPGFEKFAAEILFSMSTGQLGQSCLKSLMAKQPQEAQQVNLHLQRLYMAFLASVGENNSEEDDEPIIRPSEVLGRVQ